MKRNSKEDYLGKIGEKQFFSSFKKHVPRGFKLLNVTDSENFKALGIDFALVPRGATLESAAEDIRNGERRWVVETYEVKTDTKVSDTRNVIYETSSSSSKPGWTVTSAADKLIYYGIDENENIRDAWIMGMKDFRDWFLKYSRLENRHYIDGVNKSKAIRSLPPNGYGRIIFGCNIDIMLKDGVARELGK